MSQPALDHLEDEQFIAAPNRGFDRRTQPRESTHSTGLVAYGSGRTASCLVVDRSREGFRIKLLAAAELPDQFFLIDLIAGVGHQGHIAWRDGPFVGARCASSYDLRIPQQGDGLHMQQVWQTALD